MAHTCLLKVVQVMIMESLKGPWIEIFTLFSSDNLIILIRVMEFFFYYYS